MLRETPKRFNVLILLVLTLLSTAVVDTRAQSAPIQDDLVIQQSTSGNPLPGLPMASKQIPQRNRCNVKRRALIGAAVGSVIGMVAVRKAAEANDGTIGVKTTLHAGGYGAALGGFIGVLTCR
jgi:hypothetical protein